MIPFLIWYMFFITVVGNCLDLAICPVKKCQPIQIISFLLIIFSFCNYFYELM